MFKRLLLMLGLVACRDTPAVSSTTRDADSARQFVQDFYDWYVPLGERLPGSRTDSVVLGRAALFVPALQQALAEDLAAQRDAQEIVGVLGDYDPFLMSQDPCPRYEARTATPHASGVEVELVRRCAGETATVAVLVDVVRDGAAWRFSNFRPPDIPTFHLLGELRATQAQRDTAPSVERTTLRLLRDVPVVRGGEVQDRRGVLYADTSLVLARGTTLISTGDVGEGACRVYVGASRLFVASCPWLPGFRDPQADIFAVQPAHGRPTPH